MGLVPVLKYKLSHIVLQGFLLSKVCCGITFVTYNGELYLRIVPLMGWDSVPPSTHALILYSGCALIWTYYLTFGNFLPLQAAGDDRLHAETFRAQKKQLQFKWPCLLFSLGKTLPIAIPPTPPPLWRSSGTSDKTCRVTLPPIPMR